MEQLNKKRISSEIEKIVNANLQVLSDDKELLESLSEFKWEDLEKLHEDLGNKIIEFIANVTSIITNVDILKSLDDQKENFDRLVELFFTDINNFSFKVKEIYEKHSNRTGCVQNLNEYDEYNRLSIQYNYLVTELLSITAPTISEMILIVKEKYDDKQNKQPVTINAEVTEVKEGENNGNQ